MVFPSQSLFLTASLMKSNLHAFGLTAGPSTSSGQAAAGERARSSHNDAVNRRRFLQQSARAAPSLQSRSRASARAIGGDPAFIVGAGGHRDCAPPRLLRKAGLPVVVLEAQAGQAARVGHRLMKGSTPRRGAIQLPALIEPSARRATVG
jgi:hypothetical protein